MILMLVRTIFLLSLNLPQIDQSIAMLRYFSRNLLIIIQIWSIQMYKFNFTIKIILNLHSDYRGNILCKHDLLQKLEEKEKFSNHFSAFFFSKWGK